MQAFSESIIPVAKLLSMVVIIITAKLLTSNKNLKLRTKTTFIHIHMTPFVYPVAVIWWGLGSYNNDLVDTIYIVPDNGNNSEAKKARLLLSRCKCIRDIVEHINVHA